MKIFSRHLRPIRNKFIHTQQSQGSQYYDIGLDFLSSKHFPKAIDYLGRAQKLNVGKAFLTLGEMYACGTGVDKNLLEAEKLYRTAVQKGVPEAHLSLGNLSREKKSLPTAIFEYQQALKVGLVDALVPLVECGFEMCHFLNNEALGKNVLSAFRQVFVKLGLKNDFKDAKDASRIMVEYLYATAKSVVEKNPGDLGAKCGLGEIYLYDSVAKFTGQENPLEKAFELFEIASESNGRAVARLGWFYLEGKGGITQDFEKAKQLFEKSTDESAKGHLARMHYEGLGVPSNNDLAREIAMVGSNKGDVYSKVLLVNLMLRGQVTNDQSQEMRTLLSEVLERDPFNPDALELSKFVTHTDKDLFNSMTALLEERFAKWIEALEDPYEIQDKITSEMSKFSNFSEIVNEFTVRQPVTKITVHNNVPQIINDLEGQYWSYAPHFFGDFEYKHFQLGTGKVEVDKSISEWKNTILNDPTVLQARKDLAKEVSYDFFAGIVKKLEVEKEKWLLYKDQMFLEYATLSRKVFALIPQHWTEREFNALNTEQLTSELEEKLNLWKDELAKIPEFNSEEQAFFKSASVSQLKENLGKWKEIHSKFSVEQPEDKNDKEETETIDLKKSVTKIQHQEDWEILQERQKQKRGAKITYGSAAPSDAKK